MNVKSVTQITTSKRTIKLVNASIAKSTYAWTARALSVVSSAMKPRIISSTLLPFVRDVNLIIALIVKVLLVVSSVTKLKTTFSTLHFFVKNALWKTVWIVKISQPVLSVTKQMITFSIRPLFANHASSINV